MSADIIQFIPRPNREDMHTDFPAIAFPSTLQNPGNDPVDALWDQPTAPVDREA